MVGSLQYTQQQNRSGHGEGVLLQGSRCGKMAVGWGGTGIPLPGYDKQHAADPQVGKEDVHPNVGRQGVEEGEDTGVGPVGLPVQDADPQGHEGLGEVDRFLPNVGDGERSNGQVSFLHAAPRKGGTRERERC